MVEKIPLTQAIKSMTLPAIVAFGNPLLDIIVVLNEDGLLNKYGLKMDSEVELPEETMQQLIKELPSELMTTFDGGSLGLEKTISAGGCAQNTLRILQWLYGGANAPHIGIFCGGLGNDDRGTLLTDLVSAAGIDVRYAIHSTLPTGVCVSMIRESSRSLVANIGAADVYTLNDLKKIKFSFDAIKIIYIEGYFITHSIDVARDLINSIQDRNIAVAFNLSGAYIFENHHEAICEMVGLARIVFGNAREMTALAQALNLKFENVVDIPFLLNSLKRVTVDVSSSSSNDWLTDEGLIIMTQGGSSPAIAVWGKGQSVQVRPVVPELPVVDTTGAGDSLVAGVLAGILAGWDPKSCLQLGCKVASLIVTRRGVTLPNVVPSDFLQ